MPLTTLIPLLLAAPHTLHALQFNINPRRRSVLAPPPEDGLTLNNSADISYHADIVLGGRPYQVLIDTGSSDLWVAGDVQESTDTGFTSGVKYAIGRVKGPIKTARLEFADYIVDNQAFLQIPSSSINQDGSGILGLGPSAGSFILASMQSNTSGAPVLDRIFLQNSSLPTFFTILLGRQRDPTTFFSGTITIGSVHSDYPEVLTQARHPVKLLSQGNKNQHFQISLDNDGIIGPDGKPISIESNVDDSGGGPIVILDCGFSLPQVPRSIADAIYGRFQEAEYTTVTGIGGIWILPCEQEVNVTFIFNGTKYPIHPLDMSLRAEVFGIEDLTNSNGKPVCLGSFQPFTYDRGADPSYDMVLGMAFMRNVYTLFDYSHFLVNTQTISDPYIQMLSIVDSTEAHLDFVKARLGGIDTTGQTILNNSETDSTPSSNRVLVYVIVAIAVVAIILVVAVWLGCWIKAKAKRLYSLDEVREVRRS